MKETAERLGRAVACEARRARARGRRLDGERMAAMAEDEAKDVLKELMIALLAPGGAGISLLERIVGRQ